MSGESSEEKESSAIPERRGKKASEDIRFASGKEAGTPCHILHNYILSYEGGKLPNQEMMK